MNILCADGSIYTVDAGHHIISGGSLSVPLSYVSAQLMCGGEGVITLADGSVVTTPVIVKYLGVGSI